MGELVAFLNDHPEADVNEILMVVGEGSEQTQLIELAKKPLALNEDAWLQELIDGCASLLRQREKVRRLQRNAELRERGEEERIRDYLPQFTSGEDP